MRHSFQGYFILGPNGDSSPITCQFSHKKEAREFKHLQFYGSNNLSPKLTKDQFHRNTQLQLNIGEPRNGKFKIPRNLQSRILRFGGILGYARIYSQDFQDSIESWKSALRNLSNFDYFRPANFCEVVQKNGTPFCIKNAENGSRKKQEITRCIFQSIRFFVNFAMLMTLALIVWTNTILR